MIRHTTNPTGFAMPRASSVIPAHNCVAILLRALDSAQNQSGDVNSQFTPALAGKP